MRLIKSTGKVTRELTKVINGRIELVKCSQVGRRIAKGFDKGCRGGSRQRIDRGLNTSSEEKASSYTDIQTHSALYTTTWVLPLLSHTAVRTQNTLYDTL